MKLKDNIFSIAIVILLLILVFSKPGDGIPEQPKIERDTVWIKFDSIVYQQPQIIETIERENHYYIPDSTYEGLLMQFEKIVQKYIAVNVHSDTLKIDDIGYVHVRDSVTENKIKWRDYNYSLNYPETTVTIREPYVPKNQFYFGGGLQTGPVDAVKAGLLFKNKRDAIIKGSVGLTNNLQFQFDAEAYFKLKF